MIYNTKGRFESVRENVTGSIVLSGDRGLGKKEAAEELAMSVLGVTDKEKLKVSSDYFCLSLLEAIKIDDLKAVHDFVSLMPVESDKKVVIIDNADTMNNTCQNSLLKLLEEKTATNVFILVANDKLLPTIISRSKVINFYPLSADQMKSLGKTDTFALAVANGRPGIYDAYMSDKEYMTYVKAVYETLSKMGNKRELFKVFHLIKEKDKDMFFEKFETDKVLSLLVSIKEIFLKVLCLEASEVVNLDNIRMLYTDSEICDILRKYQEAIELMRYKGAFNKNDFFDLIRAMV